MLAMLEAIGIVLLAAVLVLLLILFALLIVGGYRAIKNEWRGGRKNGNNNPEP